MSTTKTLTAVPREERIAFLNEAMRSGPTFAKTPKGSWRFVGASYTDGTFGTMNEAGRGRYMIFDAAEITAVKS